MSDVQETPRQAGESIVDFVLEGLDGKTYSSAKTRETGLILVILFRGGCGTCQYSAPYFQRFHDRYAKASGGSFQVWGISQDNEEKTRIFADIYGLTFPLLCDTMLEITEQYGVTHVPNLYLLGSSPTLNASVLGHFGKEDFNSLAKQIAQFLEVPYRPIVEENENAPSLKPG